MPPCRVLFICEGNSARSIMYEATLNRLGQGRFEAFSAGSEPLGRVNPHALAALADAGIPAAGLRSKSWHDFTGPQAPVMHMVIRVCERPGKGVCPMYFGDFARGRWNMPDPAGISGNVVHISEAFRKSHTLILYRVMALVDLPVERMARHELEAALDRIACVCETDYEDTSKDSN